MKFRGLLGTVVAGFLVMGGRAGPLAAQFDSTHYGALTWRTIGPFRAGRTKAATGVPSQPNVFYIAAVNGGVWKTTDFGRVWTPLFDAQPTGSVGAIAVAPSDPNIIYVGSGEGLQRPDLSTGDGIYKSTDAGRTWRHLGLRDGQQIPQIAVDPRDPERLFVAVLGHPYGPNPERGLYRSNDGGQNFSKVLGKDENTGAIDVVLDPRNPDIVYAALWEARQGPWENGEFSGPESGLFKSTDGGTTWTPLTNGLPTFAADGLGRIGITIAPSDPSRLFVTTDLRSGARLYRSDDAGASWYQATTDSRVVGRASDFAEVKVDPKNPDIVYTASVVTWKSTDGGKTFASFRGAPGGDDYHRLWINPTNPDIILIASDQGAVITVNGGKTFSSWYNQPTAQFYHVSTDNGFPYRVCGGQQESGSACVASRGDDGQIGYREWHPVAVEEYGYVAADPLDPDIIYGGKLTRYDRRTGDVQNIAPKAFRSADYRALRTAPVLFSPVNPRVLYFAANTIWKTTNGGNGWTQISPDLTRRDSVVPASVGIYASSAAARARHPGVVYTVAPSPLNEAILWAGTDDGLIHVTMTGGASWKNVTPPALRSWDKVSLMDASHFNRLGAYAAINTLRVDELVPHIYRTRDGGGTWAEITTGIPRGETVNAVREDPKRKGLLFAATERAVYVSFDDGDHWHSLRLNMPVTSIRDLVIKDDDLVVGTHGRGFWILDDISPLRELTGAVAGSTAHLYRPAVAIRARWAKYPDTPVPPDEPGVANPPDGATVTYWLSGAADGPVKLEILDSTGRTVRQYTSTDPVTEPGDEGNVPRYWIRPPRRLGTTAGMHRFGWDFRFETPPVEQSYPISAIYQNTVKEPRGPWALPGRYSVRLTVAGKQYVQPLVLKMDPRVKTPITGLRRQFRAATELAQALATVDSALSRIRGLRAEIKSRRSAASGPLAEVLDSLDQRAGRFEGRGGRFGATNGTDSFGSLATQLQQLYGIVEGSDATPTSQAESTIQDRIHALRGLDHDWTVYRTRDVAAANRKLRDAGMEPVTGDR